MRFREQQNNLKPAIPYIYLYGKNTVDTFTSIGQFHTWDTTKIKTAHFQYTVDTDKITLGTNSSGFFLIEFDCSFITYTNAWIQVISSIYKNGTYVEGTESYCSIYATILGPTVYASQTIHAVVYLEKGDNIKIHTYTNNAGNTYNLGDTCRLIISFIPMRGWDNSSAGREQYCGEIAR